jgi:dCTP deaminase
MFLSDHQIKNRTGMIEPFVDKQVKSNGSGRKLLSYGLSSYGYDARLDETFLVPRFDPTANMVVDPKDAKVSDYDQFSASSIVIPPHSFVLGQTIEYFRIPRDVLSLCIGKSTYARCGVIINVTPLEPEWEGHVTIEISNTNVKPALIYAGEGIAQFLFAWCDPFGTAIDYINRNYVNDFNAFVTRYRYNLQNECEVSYADRKGKYQAQKEVTVAKI